MVEFSVPLKTLINSIVVVIAPPSYILCLHQASKATRNLHERKVANRS